MLGWRYLSFPGRCRTATYHSNLTRARERFGLAVFRRFFEGIVEMCVGAGLVRGEDLYFDGTKVDANASLDSIAPRFAVDEHLDGLFGRALLWAANDGARAPLDEPEALPAAHGEDLLAENASREDWIARNGRQRREVKGVWYRRTADFLASRTDPDSSPMKRHDRKGSHLGYYAHYVVDGGKARIILNALVTPFEVTENAPMLDLLWRSAFRWKLRPRQVTGDTTYGATENIAAVERAGVRAYVPLTGAGKARPYFSKEEFAYDPEQDLYRCPAKEVLLPRTKNKARRLTVYKAKAGTCEACELKPK